MTDSSTPPAPFVDFDYVPGDSAPPIDPKSPSVQSCAAEFRQYLQDQGFAKGTWNAGRAQSPEFEQKVFRKGVAAVHDTFGEYNEIIAKACADKDKAQALKKIIDQGNEACLAEIKKRAHIYLTPLDAQQCLEDLLKERDQDIAKFNQEWATGIQYTEGPMGDAATQEYNYYICGNFATMTFYLYRQEGIPCRLCYGYPNGYGLQADDLTHAWVEVTGQDGSLYIVEATTSDALTISNHAVTRVVKCAATDDMEAKVTETGKVYIRFRDDNEAERRPENVAKLYQALGIQKGSMPALSDSEKLKLLSVGQQVLAEESQQMGPSDQVSVPQVYALNFDFTPDGKSVITYEKVNSNSLRYGGVEFIRVQGTPWQTDLRLNPELQLNLP